jgi:hypothetical protein
MVLLKIRVFCFVTPSRLAHIYRRFGRLQNLHFHDQALKKWK